MRRDGKMNDSYKNRILPVLFGVYCASLMLQNILATKTIDVAVFTVTTGVLVSPLVFIIQDVASELYGYEKAKRMILLSFAMNFLATVLFQVAIALPPSATYGTQEAFETILNSTFRITCASFAAYVTGSLINSKIMVVLKEKHNKSLFTRAITSTLAGQFIDNAVFSIGAFAFVLPWPAILSMIVGATLFEVVYEIVFFPVTKRIIHAMQKKMEEEKHASDAA